MQVADVTFSQQKPFHIWNKQGSKKKHYTEEPAGPIL